MEFPHAFFQGLQRGGSVQIHLLPVHVLPPEVIWKLYMNITKLLLLNPAENPKLIPTFFMLALRVVSVALWWSGSGLEVTLSPSAGCLQVLNLWGLGWVIFSFSCYCFSLITTKTSLWQDFLLPIFLVLSFVSTVSPVKTATLVKWCEKSKSLLYLLYQGKPETGTNSQVVLLKKNYLPTRNQNPPIAATGCSISDSVSVVHKRHAVFW